MILVVTLSDSPRLQFVLNFMRSVIDEVEIKHAIVNHWKEELPASEFKIAYGNNVDRDGFQLIIPHCELLFESSYNPRLNIAWDQHLECLEFAKVPNEKGIDIFASIFFLLSRYQEYRLSNLDSLGRFPSSSCTLVRANQHLTPWVNIWIQDILDHTEHPYKLKKLNPIPTMDIDVAYDFLGRSGLRKWGGIARDVLNPKRLLKRLRVSLGIEEDPAFIFDKIKDKAILYFIQMSDKGKLDKSCGLQMKSFQDFLKSAAEGNIGLHPSTHSYLNLDEMIYEHEQLEVLSNKSVQIARFHYIKLKLPYSYELLCELGIKQDYSMGWPDVPGYRAGTNFSFPFFNLTKNEVQNLIITPFTWMDAHYIFSDKKNMMEADFNKFMEDTEDYGGQFVPIFHNNHFHNNPKLYHLLETL